MLEQLRSERRRFDQAARWRVADKHPLSDTIKPADTGPEEDAAADSDPNAQTTSHAEWAQAVVRMVATAAHTILQSNSDLALKSVKAKQSGFSSREEFERYLLGLIENQHGRCAVSGLPLQRDEACKDAEMLASLDRIDSSGHYTPGNLQVVCRFINRWKGIDDNALFLRLLGELRQSWAQETV